MELSQRPQNHLECENIIWLPTIELDFGQERFFTENPSKTFRSGKFNKVPVIAGRTEDEFESLTKGDEYIPKVYT